MAISGVSIESIAGPGTPCMRNDIRATFLAITACFSGLPIHVMLEWRREKFVSPHDRQIRFSRYLNIPKYGIILPHPAGMPERTSPYGVKRRLGVPEQRSTFFVCRREADET